MHPPRTPGPRSRLLLIAPRKPVRAPPEDFTEISNVVWAPAAPAIAIANWHDAGEVVWLDGRRQRLPAGWTPASWNSAGTRLLVVQGPITHPRRLGIWSPRHPRNVTVIGRLPGNATIAQIFWLAKPARL